MEIGIFMGAYAGLELVLWKFYARILGHKDHNVAVDLLGNILSFSTRMDMIIRYLPHAPGGDKIRKRCVDLLTEARAINAFRNAIAHGLYFVRYDKTLVVHTDLTNPIKKNGKVYDLSDKIMKAETEKIIKLVKTIVDEFLEGDLSFDFAAPT